MRACEGCRRRKIKCDAATTNTWPCSACVRLKLHCIPPTVNYERDTNQAQGGNETERAVDFDPTGGPGEEDYNSHPALSQHLTGDSRPMQQPAYGDHSIFQTS